MFVKVENFINQCGHVDALFGDLDINYSVTSKFFSQSVINGLHSLCFKLLFFIKRDFGKKTRKSQENSFIIIKITDKNRIRIFVINATTINSFKKSNKITILSSVYHTKNKIN